MQFHRVRMANTQMETYAAIILAVTTENLK